MILFCKFSHTFRNSVCLLLTDKRKFKKIKLLSPTAGNVIPLRQVSDEVFSQGLLGKGLGIQLDTQKNSDTLSMREIVSPLAGRVTALFPHAFAITGENNLEVLVHIGIDTVELQGKYFVNIAHKGDKVSAGDVITCIDEKSITSAGYDATVIVSVLDNRLVSSVSVLSEYNQFVQSRSPILCVKERLNA